MGISGPVSDHTSGAAGPNSVTAPSFDSVTGGPQFQVDHIVKYWTVPNRSNQSQVWYINPSDMYSHSLQRKLDSARAQQMADEMISGTKSWHEKQHFGPFGDPFVIVVESGHSRSTRKSANCRLCPFHVGKACPARSPQPDVVYYAIVSGQHRLAACLVRWCVCFPVCF